MCGIFFFYSKNSSTLIEDWIIDIATSQLSNRGPDYSSVQISPENDILLVNSVLSINQGSSYSNFPDVSSNEFFGFNGEIYENSNTINNILVQTQSMYCNHFATISRLKNFMELTLGGVLLSFMGYAPEIL